MVARGGPTIDEYEDVRAIFSYVEGRVDNARIVRVFHDTLVPECIHGWGYLKPYGYPGDHVIIDRIYTYWLSNDPQLRCWDEFFHAQPAPRAVRNRKDFLVALLRDVATRCSPVGSVLNVGSGPGRDILEFFEAIPDAPLQVTCIDNDLRAITYAANLCKSLTAHVSFRCANALRYRPKESFDLIWSAGLFDYLNDRQFFSVMRRLYAALKPGGELVIGNFGSNNPSRSYMELLGQWFLHHRSVDDLRQLAATLEVPRELVRIDSEPEGINLFLRLRSPD